MEVCWSDVLGLHGKVLVAGGYSGGFSEKLQKFSLSLTEPMPAASKADPLLAKAGTISV